MTRGEGTSLGPLHVVNPRDSLELEAMSSDAPPRYSSDRQASPSIGALQQGGHLKSHTDNEDDSLSMHSCPDGGLHEPLPSPYSTENLIQTIDTSQGHDYTVPAAPSSTYSRVCSHGYTYNHIHCCQRTDSLTAPSSYDPHREPTLFKHEAPAASHLTSRRLSSYPGSIMRHSSTPAIPQLLYQTNGLYQHVPASQPAAIGHLVYDPLDVDPEPRIYHPEVTLAFRPEGSLSQHPNRRNTIHSTMGDNVDFPQLNRGVSLRSVADQGVPHQARPTNFVSLSRKSTYKSSSFPFIFRPHNGSGSSITGTYTIDPHLRIPGGLFKRIEASSVGTTPIQNSDSLPEETHTTSETTVGPRLRRKNLMLEVENGGINIDITLVASPKTRAKVPTTPMMTTGPPLTTHQGDGRTPTAKHQPRIPTVPAPLPTLIDLRLQERKPDPRNKSSFKATMFPLCARINAPSPRPPFHLLASTIDAAAKSHRVADEVEARVSEATAAPNIALSPLGDSIPSSRTNSKKVKSHPRFRPMSKSPVTIYLPRSFHGSLNIHIAAGDIDAHLHLSHELNEAAVILQENANSRGYFVGGFGEFGVEDVEDGWQLVNREDYYVISPPQGNVGTLRGHRDGVENADFEDGEGDEWRGDKVDVVVGNGQIFLQFLDELDPFHRSKQFWRKLGLGLR